MEKNKTGCFFGHREVTHNIRPKLTAIIEKLITEDDVTDFYGNTAYIEKISDSKEKHPTNKPSVIEISCF